MKKNMKMAIFPKIERNTTIPVSRVERLAHELYPADPDLFCIQGEYYFRIGRKEREM